MKLLCVLLGLAASASAVTVDDIHKHYKNTKKYKVGEWQPPPPPAKESSGLKGKVPIPTFDSDAASGFEFSKQRTAFKGGARKLMMGGESPMGSKVPHNWFGQGKYQAPMFEIATGMEECEVCKLMIDTGEMNVDESYNTSEGAEAAGLEAMGLQPGQKNLCTSIDKKYKDMCKGYLKYLIDCPSFVHNICHEDMGGSERLRAPCPSYLKCYYCLRINPLYCVDTDNLV
jgi:hypothetical protein